MKKIFPVLGALILVAPLVVWATYKPARILAPEWVEMVSCMDSKVCLEDESKYPEAADLYENASHFVGRSVGPFQRYPRLIFCSTQACVQSFGLKSTAKTFGKWGIVIGPRGWRDYYVRHEMLHHRQVEELGVIPHLLLPKWFVEGMAYSFSEDPRRPLTEPWQQYRAEFETWIRKVGKDKLWEEAKKL